MITANLIRKNPSKIVLPKSAKGQFYEVGTSVEDKGIYCGAIVLSSELPVGHIWIARKTLEGLTGQLHTYRDSLEAIAALRNIDGRDGLDMRDAANDGERFLSDYFKRLASGESNGKSCWFLPPKIMIDGRPSTEEHCVFKKSDGVQNTFFDINQLLPVPKKLVNLNTREERAVFFSCSSYNENYTFSVDIRDKTVSLENKELVKLSACLVALEF